MRASFGECCEADAGNKGRSIAKEREEEQIGDVL
jgi:hypothetical protein